MTQKFAIGLVVRLLPLIGEREEIGRILQYQGDGVYTVQLTVEHHDNDENPQGLMVIHERYIQFMHQEGER